MSPANWSHYESGRNSHRALDIPAVADLFDMTADELLDRLLKPRRGRAQGSDDVVNEDDPVRDFLAENPDVRAQFAEIISERDPKDREGLRALFAFYQQQKLIQQGRQQQS